MVSKERKIMFSGKIIALVAALFVGCLSGQVPGQAQSKQSDVLYAEPSHLMLKGEENADKEEAGNLIREKFYPIGWSKDGKFAYYVEPPDEACGCYFANLIIQDLRTDEILWQRKYNSQDKPEDTIQKYWAKNQKEFSEKLAEYKIETVQKFSLLNSAIKYQKDSLTPKLKVNLTQVDEENYFLKGSVVLQMVSKKKGTKTIYEKKYNPKEVNGIRNAELGGSLLSPFEPRAAIILLETNRGWEGPPHVVDVKIIGASLTTGFQ